MGALMNSTSKRWLGLSTAPAGAKALNYVRKLRRCVVQPKPFAGHPTLAFKLGLHGKFPHMRDLDLLHADQTVVKMPPDTAKGIMGFANVELIPERGVGVRRFRRPIVWSRLEFLPEVLPL